jgi:hypothetical protein
MTAKRSSPTAKSSRKKTHIIPHAYPIWRNRYRALCGEEVDGDQHASDGAPECDRCRELEDEDTRALDSLKQS